VGVKLGPQVDVALRPAQRPEIFAHVFGIGRAGDHRGHHEREIDDFAKAELLGEIVRAAEQ
jgi:hypothetical protein